MSKSEPLNPKDKRDFVKVNLANRCVSVIIEEREADGGATKEYTLTFRHDVNDGLAVFESFYKGKRIKVPVGNRPKYEVGEYQLPKEFIEGSKDRIREAVSKYIDRLEN